MKNKAKNIRQISDRIGEKILLLFGMISIVTVVMITVFILQKGLPFFAKSSFVKFLFSTDWSPSASVNPGYGIFSFMVASLEVTLFAMIMALPIALACAVYLSEFARGRLARLVRSGIELLAGIPSIIFGLFGIAVIVPFVRIVFGGNGYSLLSASIILAIMILPTIINFSEVSMRSVPSQIREASLAMGATKWQTIYRVVIPSSLHGIISSVILAFGRAVGETTAVVLVGGNAPLFAVKPTDMGRTLTMNIITDMSYAEGTHMNALFATAMLLFVFIIVTNLIVVHIMNKESFDA